MDEGYAIILASVMAICGIFITSSLQRSLLRKQHTYDVLDKMNAWDDLEKNIKALSQMVKSQSIPSIKDSSAEKKCDQIDFVLNHYEFICASIISGDLDESLVRRIEKSRICRSYLKTIQYIFENRADRQTDSMWENIELICYRWMIEKNDSYESFMDRLFGKIHVQTYQQKRLEIGQKLAQLSREIA